VITCPKRVSKCRRLINLDAEQLVNQDGVGGGGGRGVKREKNIILGKTNGNTWVPQNYRNTWDAKTL